MTDLTLTGLRVVLEVARTGSFSAAAERLGYTQSAVSRQVAVTEKAVGTPLFERHARGTRPTPAGEALARHAGKVLDEITAATQELAGMRDRLAGRLVVSGFPAATAALLPRAIARLTAVHPGLKVQLTEAPTPAQLAAMRRGRTEVAIVATGDGLPELRPRRPAPHRAAQRPRRRGRGRGITPLRRPGTDRARRARRPGVGRRVPFRRCPRVRRMARHRRAKDHLHSPRLAHPARARRRRSRDRPGARHRRPGGAARRALDPGP